MRIAIPVNGLDTGSNQIAGSLNVMGYLCIFDTETKENRAFRTRDLAPNMADLLPALDQQTVSAVITRQIHPMALKVLTGRGLIVYRSEGVDLEENIRMLQNETLGHFDMDGAMSFAKVCGGECSDCRTDCDTESGKP